MKVVTLNGATYLAAQAIDDTLVAAIPFQGQPSLNVFIHYVKQENIGRLQDVGFKNQVFTERDLDAVEEGQLVMAQTLMAQAKTFAIKDIENKYMDTLLGK